QGKGHLTTIQAPTCGRGRGVGGGRRGGLWGGLTAPLGESVRACPGERQAAFDGPASNRGPRQETPDAAPPGSWVALGEVRDRQPEGPPALAGRGWRRPAFVPKPCQCCGLNAAHPRRDGPRRPVEPAAETPLAPALPRERTGGATALLPRGRGRRGAGALRAWRGPGAVLPERLDGLRIPPLAHRG